MPGGEFGGARVEYANGTNRTFPDVQSFDHLPHQATKDAVSIVPLAENATVRTYRLTPGSGVGTTFEDVPRNATVVDVVSRPDAEEPLRSFGTSTCVDADLTWVILRVTTNGSIELHTTCGDATATG